MFDSIASGVIRRGWVVVLVWGLFTAGLYFFAPTWEQASRDDDVKFFPAGYPSVVGYGLLDRGFPKDASSSNVVVITEREHGRLGAADYAFVDRVIDHLSELRKDDPELGIKKIDTYRTPVIGPRLLGTSRDQTGQAVLTSVSLNGTYLAKSTRLAVERLLDDLKRLQPVPAGLNLAVTGSAVVGHDMNNASNESMNNTTYWTIGLVVVILLVVYRSPLLALIPLLTIALSAWTSLKVLAWLTKVPGIHFQVINITQIFVIVVLFGAGTDYCLFLIARYREELVRGRDRDEALREAIVQVGGALIASAGTVIVGLGMLWFSTFAKIQYTGPAIAMSLGLALLAALTLAPVLLHWLRAAVFWPFLQPHHEAGANREAESLEQLPLSSFWLKVANLVVNHPGKILSLCVLALLPFAVIGARTRPNYSQLADLNADRPSVIGSKVVQRYFAVGELGPAAVLVEHPTLNFRSEAGRHAIDQISRRISTIPNVAEVRSVSQPLGKPRAPARAMNMFDRLLEQTMRAAVDSRYVSTTCKDPADRNHITRIDVVFQTDPFSEQSLRALDDVSATLRAATAPGEPLQGAAGMGMAGASASVHDLKKVTTSDQHRMYVLVTIGVYAILVVLLRRPGICLYLIVTVVLGYLASLGMTELVFKAFHNGPDPWVGLDWKVGFFLFVVLVAVGEDYNIFLMSRVVEEERKHGMIEGTRLAVAHTGGIISSCGLIMAGTLGSMLTGSLTALRELGFALGLGVLLDTFLVRPILVPAFLVLLHRYRPSSRQAAPLSTAEATTSVP